MRVDLQNFLKHASHSMKAMLKELEERMGKKSFDKFCTEHQPAMYAGELEEVAKNVNSVSDKTHTLEEFAKYYCIIPSET